MNHLCTTGRCPACTHRRNLHTRRTRDLQITIHTPYAYRHRVRTTVFSGVVTLGRGFKPYVTGYLLSEIDGIMAAGLETPVDSRSESERTFARWVSCLSPSLSHYLSIPMSLYLSLSLYLSIPIYLSLYPYLSISLYLYLSIHISLYLSIYLYLSMSLYISISLSLYPSISLSLYLSISLSLRFSASIHRSKWSVLKYLWMACSLFKKNMALWPQNITVFWAFVTYPGKNP